MMKHLARIALMLALVLALVGCGKTEQPPADTTAATETMALVAPSIVFVGGENTYTIVRAEVTNETVWGAASSLYKTINATVGMPISIGTDWLKSGTEPAAYEILIGEVDREECRAAMAELPYCGYLIKVMGEKLVIVAGDDAYLDDAVAYLVEHHLTAEGLSLPADFVYSEDLKPGGYPLADATLGGIKLTDYSIVTRNTELGAAVQAMIGDRTGRRLPVRSDLSDADARSADAPMILLGSSSYSASTALTYYNYRTAYEGNKLLVDGYDTYAIKQAVGQILDHIEAAQGKALDASAAYISYTLPDREVYMADPTKLYMRWSYDFTPDPAMLDFAAKKEALFGGKGTDKLYASAHRADWKHYPENSIEAIISTYYMGATIAELDFACTKDGVLILSHDATLSRMTNCAEFIGKPGYPSSDKVADWTYEQIKSLNLKEGGGGASARVTPFKVATVEEALAFCKDRLFIVPDKQDQWQYVKSDNIMKASKQVYLSDLMKKTGNYDSILISYGKSSANYLTALEAVKLQTLLKAETGATAMIYIRSTPNDVVGNYTYLSKYAEPASYAIQLNGDYRASTNYEDAYKSYGDKLTFMAWTIGTGDGYNDFAETWSTMYKKGLRVIMTNDLLGLMQYSATVNEGK